MSQALLGGVKSGVHLASHMRHRPQPTLARDPERTPGPADEVGCCPSSEASNRRVRALVQHSYDGIAVVDRRGIVTFANDTLCHLLGTTETEAVGRSAFSFIEWVDQDRMRVLARPDPDRGLTDPVELRLLTADGTWLPFEGHRTDLTDDPDINGVVWNLKGVAGEHRAELALRRSEERLQALAAGSSDVTVVNDLRGLTTYAGPSMEAVFGYRNEEFLGTRYDAFVHPDDLAANVAIASETLAAGSRSWSSRYRLRHRDGSWRWVDTRFTDLRDNPAVAGVIANIRDVTDQTALDEALRASEYLYRSMVETAEEGICIHDLEGRLIFANPKMASLVGSTVGALLEGTIFDLVHPSERTLARQKLRRRQMGVAEQYEFSLLRADGSTCDVLISASPLHDAEGVITGVLSMMTDIRDRKRAEAANARLALEDSLTGVASRTLVVDRVAQLVAHQDRQPGVAAVVYLDLDNFKLVNDSHGHTVGDQVLRIVATRIRAAVRPEDTLGRYGGDEFVVILDGIDGANDAVRVAERIVAALDHPIELEGLLVSCTASLGIAMTPGESPDSLMRDADIAMYRAKERGGARYELFDASLGAQVQERLAFESDVRSAITLEQFHLHYQPVVTMDGTVTGFEALARWNHPERGSVGPDQFIPVAESTGTIIALGRWILGQACRDLTRWRSLPGFDGLTMAVNLSGRQLVDAGIVATVAGVLESNRLDPSALWLEMTESVLMDDSVSASSTLAAIHDLGVKLAVDDFGTGYSSLVYLRRFPVDALKLDQTFVAGVDQHAEDATIVESVIELAHALGLTAIAEGVETAGQLAALEAMGCDLGQGYYWSTGIAAGDVDDMLARVGAVGPV
jgi:diguanylate cyclase (GGDEF)-like protein/PAS domain S-box-containing protein